MDSTGKEPEMSTLAVIVLIVIGGLLLLALAVSIMSRRSAHQIEDRRAMSAAHREEAQSEALIADEEAAVAAARAARARRELAEAEQKGDFAAARREAADAHLQRADEIDPEAYRTS
jgi:hypothetical protein